MHRSTTLQTIAVAASFLAAGCTDQTEPTAPVINPTCYLPSVQQEPGDNPNALGRGIRGFGGFFFDAQGRPTVYLKNAAERSNAERALAPFFRAQGLSPAAVQVRRGDFDWIQLERWFAQASAEVSASPARSSWTRMRRPTGFGSASSAGRPGGHAASSRGWGFPPGPSSSRRPSRSSSPRRFGIGCGPSWAGSRSTSPASSAPSASTPCGAGRTPSSPTRTAPTRKGEPRARRTGNRCRPWIRCRSGPRWTTQHISAGRTAAPKDGVAASATRRGRPTRRISSFTLGSLARTTGPNNGSITINGSFTITGEGSATVGQTVNKVGRTTGWTQGLVTNTCVNTGVSGSNIVQLCQTFVSAGVGGGDSGSPVFRGTSSVTLVGILWGGNSSGTQFVYSPIANIEQELGA